MKFYKILISVILFVGTSSYATDTGHDLSGRYLMKMTIGSRVFDDLLDLEGPYGPLPAHGTTQLYGALTVPNAFYSPITGQISCDLWVAMCRLNFEITAHENGQAFRVFYKAQLLGPNYINFLQGKPALLTGSATLENGDALGSFEALQQKR